MVQKTKTSKKKGKKGGLSVTSEVVGAAMIGASGVMLASKKIRNNLVMIKDKTLDTTGNILTKEQTDNKNDSEKNK